jgi:hypothetical protein
MKIHYIREDLHCLYGTSAGTEGNDHWIRDSTKCGNIKWRFSILISCLVIIKFPHSISYFSAALNEYIIWTLPNDNSFPDDESADSYNDYLDKRLPYCKTSINIEQHDTEYIGYIYIYLWVGIQIFEWTRATRTLHCEAVTIGWVISPFRIIQNVFIWNRFTFIIMERWSLVTSSLILQ